MSVNRKEWHREYDRKKYLANPEKYKALNRAYYAANREKMAAYWRNKRSNKYPNPTRLCPEVC